MHSQTIPTSYTKLSNVIGLSDFVTQPISSKVPSLFPFLKKYIQATLDFPVCQCSLRWLPAMSADCESRHCCTLARLLLHPQQLEKKKDGHELSDIPPSRGTAFFSLFIWTSWLQGLPSRSWLCDDASEEKKNQFSPFQKESTFKKIHLCSAWIIYLGNPFLRGGPSFEPHSRDVFSEANANDWSSSSGT